MRIFLLGLLAFLLSFQIAAQDKKVLTLNASIMDRREISPATLSGLECVSSNQYAYRNSDGDIEIMNEKGAITHTISLSDLNVSFRKSGLDTLKSVRAYDWMSDHIMVIKHGNAIFTYNYITYDLQQLLEISENSENLTFNNVSGFMAYTIGPDVYVSTTDGMKRVTNHEGTETSAGIAIHRSEFGIVNGLFWSENGDHLGFYEMDESMVTDYPLADYSTIPAILENIKYPMAGQASHHAKVGVYQVANDKLVYLKTGEPLEQYLTNFTFSPDAGTAYLAVVNRDQNHMKLNAYSTGTGELEKTLFEEKDEKYVEPENPPYFMPDGKTFMWFSERDGFNHLYHYDYSGNLLGQITKGELVVKSIVGVTQNGKNILVETTDGFMGEAIYNVAVKSGRMTKITKEHGTYSAYYDGGSTLIMAHTSTDVGNVIQLCNTNGKVVKTLLEAENPFSNYEIGEVDLPIILADDGTELQARLIKPYDFDPNKKYPVLVYVYGGPHAQLITDRFDYGAAWWMYVMANRGYIVFTVDSRGSANRGLTFEQAIFRNLADNEMEDQLNGVEYLKGLSYVDGSRLAIHGWSYGGFMTTSLMLRKPGTFEVGVAGGPVTDWSLYEIMYGERYMDSPEQNPEGYKKAKLSNYVGNLQGDLLLIHGLDDNVVVPQHSYNLLEAFVDEGVQVDFFTYPGHPHNVRGIDRVHLMTKVLDYIDDKLNR
jgi:dipeptidyl-peptidase-4